MILQLCRNSGGTEELWKKQSRSIGAHACVGVDLLKNIDKGLTRGLTGVGQRFDTGLTRVWQPNLITATPKKSACDERITKRLLQM